MGTSTGRGAGGPALVGLDVGGSKIHGVLVVDDQVRQVGRFAVRRGADGVVAAAADAVAGLLRAAGGTVPPLGGVGLGVPGIVAPGAGTVAHAVNLGILDAEPVGPLLAGRVGVPVTVENDLNVAALGAAHLLGLGGDLAYLALGTGVAAGLLLDGRLRRGSRGAAGEIGHVTYRPDGPRCACGQRGCLELYASGSALDAAWPSRNGTPAPADVFAAAAEGDRDAVVLRDSFADAVAAAVQLLVLTADVEHVVLGGGVSAVGRPLLDAVSAAVGRRSGESEFLATLQVADRLRLAPDGSLVAPVGAALAAGAALAEAGTALPPAPARAAEPGAVSAPAGAG